MNGTPASTDALGRWALGRPWTTALVVGVVASVLYMALPYSPLSELVLYDGVVLLALVGTAVGYRRRRGTPQAAPAAWVVVCFTLFLIGELVWWAYSALGADPFPSPADAAFMMGYGALAIAAAKFARTATRGRDRAAWLDAGVLTVVAGLILWQLILQHGVGDSSSVIAEVVTMAYPIADLFVLGFVLRFVFSRSAHSRTGSLFGASILATLCADFAFSWQDLHGDYAPASFVDTLWLIGYLLMAAAFLVPARREALQDVDVVAGKCRLLVVLMAVLIPQAALLQQLARLDALGIETTTVALATSSVVMVLVSFRLWGLLDSAREAERRRGIDRLSAVVHHSADAVLLVDQDSRIFYASPAIEELTGVAAEWSLGQDPTAWFDSSEDGFERRIANLALLPTGSTVPLAGTLQRPDGGKRLLEGTVCNLMDDPSVGAYVVTVRDITMRRELEAQLERQAFTDGLTGLANRVLFCDRVAHALSVGAKRETQVVVIFIDVDDFKSVNDGLGHAAGDALLRQVSLRLRACLRPSDTIARFGGDEFAVLLEDVESIAQAEQTAARVLEVLRLPVPLGDVEIGVPVSIGVAFASASSTVESLLSDADLAMYSAKAQGKGRAVVFDEGLRDIASRRIALKVELAGALRDEQFRVVFQPVFDIATRELHGFEALVRWDHPTRGEVGPVDFISVAEESGDIVPIGRWVLREACTQAVAWNRASVTPLTISVNASAVQFRQRGFIDEIREVLRETGLPGHLLTIELTESVLVEHERVQAALEELRSLGVGVSIDDFGTGYSSLSYLQRFPVTAVKIDRSFVIQLTADEVEHSLVRSIIAIAEALSLSTVAEGIETEEQLLVLENLGCRFAQGFLLSRPITPAQVETLLMSPRYVGADSALQ
jgi:diguanylate cyclase (GGDEF)-like protein/PAS domain S-box-containing protein